MPSEYECLVPSWTGWNWWHKIPASVSTSWPTPCCIGQKRNGGFSDRLSQEPQKWRRFISQSKGSPNSFSPPYWFSLLLWFLYYVFIILIVIVSLPFPLGFICSFLLALLQTLMRWQRWDAEHSARLLNDVLSPCSGSCAVHERVTSESLLCLHCLIP